MKLLEPEAQTDLLGLTEEGRADTRAVQIARALEADRNSHSAVLDQVAKGGHLSDDELQQAEREFLLFAVLLGISERPLSPSNIADWYWHSFILDTRAYTSWCCRHFGRYLHHKPTPREEQEANGTIDHTVALYRKYFGTQGQLADCKGNQHDCFGGCSGDDGGVG
jgi:hypothetical protein